MTIHKTSLVVGAGAFGTSLASVLTDNFAKVIIQTRSRDLYQNLKQRENSKYLPGISLPDQLVPMLSWEDRQHGILDDVELLVMAIPVAALAEYIEQNLKELRHLLQKGIPMVCLSKGIDSETLYLPDEIFSHHLGEFQRQFCFLSGPGFAREILQRQATMVAVAGSDSSVLDRVTSMFTTDFFKVVKSCDIKGVLLGGALKNTIAIVSGIVEGMGYSSNTRAALMTIAIKDMLRVGSFYQVHPETFYGLSGIGDLLLTITGGMSRNKKFGLELAKGKKPGEIISSLNVTVEGYRTTKSVYLLCEKHGIECPIFKTIYRVLYEELSVEEIFPQIFIQEPDSKMEA